jgi:hypothetical protein
MTYENVGNLKLIYINCPRKSCPIRIRSQTDFQNFAWKTWKIVGDDTQNSPHDYEYICFISRFFVFKQNYRNLLIYNGRVKVLHVRESLFQVSLRYVQSYVKTIRLCQQISLQGAIKSFYIHSMRFVDLTVKTLNPSVGFPHLISMSSIPAGNTRDTFSLEYLVTDSTEYSGTTSTNHFYCAVTKDHLYMKVRQ